jgi:hypothetical protein
MSDEKQLIRDLAEHAIKKRGACQDHARWQENVLENPSVRIVGETLWTKFFEVDWSSDEDLATDQRTFNSPFAQLPILAKRLREHQQICPDIQDAGYSERDGHVYMRMPLDSNTDVDFVKTLIDESYALAWSKLNEHERLIIELGELPYDEPLLLDQLIDVHQLEGHREDIHALGRKAVLLRTKACSETDVACGASKFGGDPDLPEGVAWPSYRDGKPLAFLAQLDLTQLSKLDLDLAGLPKAGLLLLFSVWGWQDSEDCDPQVPVDGTKILQEESNWTVIIHAESQGRLERCKTSSGVNCFKESEIEPISIISMPNHLDEPAVAKLH